jgi:hypothetical protein
LRVRDGHALTRCAPSRTSTGAIAVLTDSEADHPTGDLAVITANLSSHDRVETTTWLAAHPRIHHVFIPTGACWLNLAEGWWRLFRRAAFAGQSFADPPEIEQATRVSSTAGALLTGKLPDWDDGANFLSWFYIWLGKYLEEKGTTFEAWCREKRLRLGMLSSVSQSSAP